MDKINVMVAESEATLRAIVPESNGQHNFDGTGVRGNSTCDTTGIKWSPELVSKSEEIFIYSGLC